MENSHTSKIRPQAGIVLNSQG